MREAKEKEVYVLEYNPKKYEKAYKVVRAISIILIILALTLSITILLYVYLNDNSFVINVNGVPTKDYYGAWMAISLTFLIPSILSLLSFVLYKRLRQANAVFSQADEKKRLQQHFEFEKQAKTVNKVWAGYSLLKL